MIEILRTIGSFFIITGLLWTGFYFMILFTLKGNGYKPYFLWYINIFKNMMELIENEASPQKKLHYKILLCSYYGSIILSILLIVLWIATDGPNHLGPN
jgi:hypothetical protein